MAKYMCDNCKAIRERDDLPDARDILQRVDPGGIFTDKECAVCGALSYPLILTAEKVQRHLARSADESRCPFCDGIFVEGESFESSGGEARQEMSCIDCNGKWTESYKLADVAEILSPYAYHTTQRCGGETDLSAK